jgi:hypothetical protein
MPRGVIRQREVISGLDGRRLYKTRLHEMAFQQEDRRRPTMITSLTLTLCEIQVDILCWLHGFDAIAFYHREAVEKVLRKSDNCFNFNLAVPRRSKSASNCNQCVNISVLLIAICPSASECVDSMEAMDRGNVPPTNKKTAKI